MDKKSVGKISQIIGDLVIIRHSGGFEGQPWTLDIALKAES